MSLVSILLGLAALVIGLWLATSFRTRVIYEGAAGLLYRNGRFVRQLDPGSHRSFDPMQRSRVFVVPVHPVALAPRTLTLVSRDQFSFRIVLVAIVQVHDARAHREAAGLKEPDSRIHPMLGQFGDGLQTSALDAAVASELLAVASQRSLEEFISATSSQLESLADRVRDATPGLAVERLLVTENVVPPEVRKMFTEVERARREGLAQLERARAEQASLRALANAARTLQDNPRLAELRMVQLMEGAKGNKTFVLGQARLDPSANGAEPA